MEKHNKEISVSHGIALFVGFQLLEIKMPREQELRLKDERIELTNKRYSDGIVEMQ